ncbi:GH25 family lysozyme [Micromonospora halotolerans]|uniref:GH25 family lysozyme n=1 Tax=Micromonospora halotolerans TaxID=709879 RepID=A0ABZ0A447_9ACTN|nr:GH25 family lysozyme [Micromonospora halotolerans]WNM42202.1 GH25 family lysozyme [Micromonospora halotolerans]
MSAGLALGALGMAQPASAADAAPDGGGHANAGVKPGARTTSASTSAAIPAGYTIRGIDVSSHDHNLGPIDWPAVAAGGAKFAYVKATEGHTYRNPYFAEDYAAAKAAGLLVGAYHFARPDGRDPVTEANFFIDNAQFAKDSQTLVPMVDIEWPYWSGAPTCYGLTTTEMSAWIKSFTDQVKARIGRPVMIYTNTNYWNPCTGNNASFGANPLDIAGYTATRPPLPAGWTTETIWQYAAGDPSTPGSYSQNVFNGDYPALTRLTGAPAVAAPIALRARINSRYVVAESAGAKPLIANRTSVGLWEQFDMVDAGDGFVALRARANGRYVVAESGGAQPLIANRTSVGAWEKFTVIDNADGSISLRANANGRYVVAENAGTQPLIANRTSIGPWEKFDRIATS